MTLRSWSAPALGLGVALAAAAWAWFAASGDTPLRPTVAGSEQPAADRAPAAAATAPLAPELVRTEAAAPPRSQPQASALAQGLRGLVVDEAFRPLPGRAVYLVDSIGNDPLAVPLLRQQRDAFGPVARTETAADGSWALGLPVAQDKVYEVYVQSPDHATARLGGLKVLAGQWHDLGAIQLAPGASLRGRVTVAGRPDIPVPGATVTVEVGGAFADATLRALPDAGQGLVTTANGNGEYELRHVPSRGVVQVTAVGAGFARQVRGNIELARDRPVEVDFGLVPGHTLAGVVLDARGAPIEAAQVEAWPQQVAAGPLQARSGADGRFEVLGLSTGAHRLRVRAPGFEPHEASDVQPGRSEVRVVLQQQSRLRVRVLTPAGTTLRSYQLALRRCFPGQDSQLAPVTEVPEQRVQLDGTADFAELPHVPIGWFRCQVEAEGFAKTLSEPIDNTRDDPAAGPRDLEVTVTLSTGAALRGRVVDEQGLPLAGATVQTQPAGTIPDNPFFRMLAGAVPERTTAAKAVTAADGSFQLPRLALADYQLLVEHPEACRTIVPALRLDQPEERMLPPIRMPTGAMVTGRATVGGRIAGQIKVVLATPGDTTDAAAAIRLETVTDKDGVFRMPRRVPPGTYELRAAVVGTAEPEAQIFQQLVQLQRSATPLAIAPGQRLVERDLDLPTDH